MRQVLFTAFAVLMTATTNFVFAQSNDVVIVHAEGQKTLEITYVSQTPHYISFEMIGGRRMKVGLYGQTSNVSNGDGTCTASYDLQKLYDSPSGESFAKSFEECEKMYIYKNRNDDEEFMFEVSASDMND